MAKKILAIDDMEKLIEEMKRCADVKRGWDTLSNFEHTQKELFLKKLTTNESLEMFGNLYRFAREIGDKAYYKKLDLRKVHALSKVHFMFMKVEL